MDNFKCGVTNSLLNLFYDGLKINPNLLAVRFDDGTDIFKLCYGEVDADSRIISDHLNDLETSSEVVCISSTPRLSTLCALIGILKAKSAFAFVDLKAAPAYNSRFFKKLKSKYAIMEDTDFNLLKKVTSCAIIKRLSCVVGDLYVIEILNDAKREKYCYSDYPLAYCIETSGSTREPKLVKVPHRCIYPNVVHFCSAFKVNVSDIIYVASPLTFDPSIVDIFMALSSGACILLVPEEMKLLSDKLMDILSSRNRVTIMQVTPSALKRFAQDKIRERLLSTDSSLRILSFGGERCPSRTKLISWKHPENSTAFFNVYGITEVSSWAFIHSIQFDDNDQYDEIPLGQPILETKYEIIDSEGELVTEAGVGHMYIGGLERVCFIGWEDSSVISKEPMRPTGDLIRIDNGRMFYVNRLDDQVKRNGKKISIKQIEMLTSNREEIEDCKAIFDEEKQCLILSIILRRNDSDVISRLKDHLSKHVPSHSYPDHIIAVDSFPVTRHGKLDKRLLLQLCQLHIISSSSVNNNFEVICDGVLQLWKVYLGKDTDLQMSSNFILHGGNSLTAIQLSNNIQSWLPKKEFPELIEKLLNSDLQAVCEYVHSAPAKLPSSHQQMLTTAGSSQSSVFLNLDNSEELVLPSPLTVSRANRVIVPSIFDKSLNMPDVQITLREDWKFNTEKCVDASPFLINSTEFESVIYVGSHSHRFYAICLGTGKMKWCVETGDRIESTACSTSDGNCVFFGGYDKFLYCVEANSGYIKWKYKVDGIIKSSPAYSQLTDCVYFGCYDHFFYAVQANNGECVWKVNISNGSIFSTPLISTEPHQLYFGTLDGKLACLCPKSGKVLWKYHFDKPIFSSCRMVPQGICVGCVDGMFYCISFSGQLVWDFATEEPIFSSPCVALSKDNNQESFVYFGSHDCNLYCVNTVNGTFKWSTKLESPVYSSPHLACVGEARDYVLIACCTNGILYCLNASNGDVIGKFKFPGDTFSSPIAFNDRIIVGCRDNNVYCLKIIPSIVK